MCVTSVGWTRLLNCRGRVSDQVNCFTEARTVVVIIILQIDLFDLVSYYAKELVPLSLTMRKRGV